MLMPSRVKYRKRQRGRLKGKSQRGNRIVFGKYGLQCQSSGNLTSAQIEAGRRAITRALRRGGKVWIRVFPDHPVTKKPAETRMGKGKGSPEFWIFKTRTGRVLFEIAGVQKEVAQRALKLASYKLPLKTKFIEKEII